MIPGKWEIINDYEGCLDSQIVMRLNEDGDGFQISQGGDSIYIEEQDAWKIFEFSRGAQGSPLCTDRGPKPAESEGVQAGAKRSPEGCLDAGVNAGHPHQRSTHELKCKCNNWRYFGGVTKPKGYKGSEELGAKWCVDCGAVTAVHRDSGRFGPAYVPAMSPIPFKEPSDSCA